MLESHQPFDEPEPRSLVYETENVVASSSREKKTSAN